MAEKVTNFDDIEKCIFSKLEKCTDDFKKANLMRLDVLASYTAHSETKINGASILEEHLENYIPLVCNTSKINNYADLLKTKLKNSSHTNKKRLTKWEITKIDDISDILTEMNVNNRKYEDDDKSKNISNDQFYKLQLLHHQFVDDVETNKSTKHYEDLTFSSTSNNQQNFRQNLLTNDNKKNKPQTSNDEFFRNASASMEHQYPFNNFNNTKNRDQSSTIGRQEIPHRNQVQVDKSNEFFQAASASMEHHHHPPPPSLSDFHNMKNSRVGNFTTERQEIPQKNEMQTDKINEFFRTASMEYHIQNIKKNVGNSMQRLQQQHDQGPSSSSFEYGISKRSLGLGGRRNVRSKFVPPVKRTLEEMEESSGQFTSKDRDGGGDSSEEIDSRLKNIDPKLIEMIKNEIMRTVTQTTWDDIAGLEYTKSVIQEAIVWPLLRPDIFTGLRRPPRGVLLFGPPGTGKTMIGKCIASQSKSTFFSISASSLTSKWVGEGEKMVRALFAVASVHQPSVVFIDEIDSLLCQRSENEHESSRRIKTEFLVQLDGAATSDDEKILIVGATNRPQELDEAARRRLVRRLYVPLPEYEARCKMLKNLLSSIKHELTDTDIKRIAELTDGYSGADIKTLCTEASLEPIRSIPANLIPVFDKDNVRPVIFTDFEMALTRVRSSVSQDDLKQYIEWNKIYGSGNLSK